MRLLLMRHGDGRVLVQIIRQHAGPGFLGAGDDKIELVNYRSHSPKHSLSKLSAKRASQPVYLISCPLGCSETVQRVGFRMLTLIRRIITPSSDWASHCSLAVQ